MKKISLIFAIAIIVFTGKVYGQYSTMCGIYFDYDAVGNRVKRSYDCKTIGEPGYPNNPTSKMAHSDGAMDQTTNQRDVLVYPNPTSGAFTINLNKVPENPVHFHWYSDQLQILGSGHITDAIFKGDISGWADGIYIIRIYESGNVYTFKIVKVSSASR